MEPRDNNTSENQDFTSKGRISNPGHEHESGTSSDISHIDQQEGELKHGTTSNDPGLFSNGDERPTGSS